MSDKVRIYQLARDLGVENSELLAALDDMGVEYKSVSSTIDAETADTVKQLLQPDEGAKKKAPAAKDADAKAADAKDAKDASAKAADATDTDAKAPSKAAAKAADA